MSIIGRIFHRGSSSGAAAGGAVASTVATAPAAANKASIFGKAGKYLMNHKLSTAFLAMTVVPALAMYKSEYNASGEKVEGVNWGSGNKAVIKALCKYLGYGLSGGLAGLACAAPLALGAPLAAGIMALGWIGVPKLLEHLFPDESEVVKKACEEKGLAYNPPSLMGSLGGGQTLTA